MELELTLTGTKQLLMNNGRGANPLDEYAVLVAQIASKRRKTVEDHRDLMFAEARSAVYETTDKVLGFPTANVWRCLYDAAKAFKLGQDVKRGLIFEDVTTPLLVDGEKVKVDDFLADEANIEIRPVNVVGRKVMRSRPIVRGWSTVHRFTMFDDVLDLHSDMVPIFERAGRLVGIGDWRPVFGTFGLTFEVVG